MLDQPLHAVDLVEHFEVPHVVLDRSFEGEAAPGTTPVVETEDQVATVSQRLGAHVDGHPPAIGHHLGVGASVDVDHGGVGAGAKALNVGLVDRSVEEDAVAVLQRDQAGRLQTELLDALVGRDFDLTQLGSICE